MLPTISHCVCRERAERSIQVGAGALLVRSMAFVVVSVLMACAAGEKPEISPQPMALLDAYLIAHGMATSYAESETAEPAVVSQLARLDRKAAQAVQSLSQVQTGDEAATAAAISALAGYAARQSIIIQ